MMEEDAIDKVVNNGETPDYMVASKEEKKDASDKAERANYLWIFSSLLIHLSIFLFIPLFFPKSAEWCYSGTLVAVVTGYCVIFGINFKVPICKVLVDKLFSRYQ